MNKREAATRLRQLAFRIRISLDEDEGADAWATELEEIAKGLDPSGA